MVSLYIPAMAELVEAAETAEDVYALLRRRCYLSKSALSNPEGTLAFIQEIRDRFPVTPELDRELSWETVEALREAGFLSVLGRTWGMRSRKRYGWIARLRTLRRTPKASARRRGRRTTGCR